MQRTVLYVIAVLFICVCISTKINNHNHPDYQDYQDFVSTVVQSPAELSPNAIRRDERFVRLNPMLSGIRVTDLKWFGVKKTAIHPRMAVLWMSGSDESSAGSRVVLCQWKHVAGVSPFRSSMEFSMGRADPIAFLGGGIVDAITDTINGTDFQLCSTGISLVRAKQIASKLHAGKP